MLITYANINSKDDLKFVLNLEYPELFVKYEKYKTLSNADRLEMSRIIVRTPLKKDITQK
jgi:hypothetical protein